MPGPLGELSPGAIELLGGTRCSRRFLSPDSERNALCFLDDARWRAPGRAVSLRRRTADDSRDSRGWSRHPHGNRRRLAPIRDADELHEPCAIGSLPEGPGFAASDGGHPVTLWLEQLEGGRRPPRVADGAGLAAWPLLKARTGASGYGTISVSPARETPLREGRPTLTSPGGEGTAKGSRRGSVLALVRGWVDSIGPFRSTRLAVTLPLPTDDVLYALAHLETEGVVLRGGYVREWSQRVL